LSYCPKCRHEYADSVERCVDCGLILRKGRRPVNVDFDFSDLLVPVGALICAVFAGGMLYLRTAAQLGWITGPFAQLVLLGQPPIMVVFYAVAAIASIIVCAMWVLQIIVRRG
jgi:hypothetical protein